MINIALIFKQQYTALEHFRQQTPHELLAIADTDFHFTRWECGGTIDNMTDDELKGFQAVQFIRHIDLNGKTKEVVDRCHKLGLKVIFDLDDHWQPDHTHPLNAEFKKRNYTQTVTDAFKYADWVTTTTKTFADEIKQYTSNVTVLPNVISTTDIQWQKREIQNSRLRFGWVGGVFHLPDIKLLQPCFDRLYKFGNEIKDDTYQFCVAGFNPNPEYIGIEKVVKSRRLDKEYQDYLAQMTQAMEHYGFDKPYRRIWTRDVYNYAQGYNEMDVCLIPLRDSKFNRCKSELKIIEAGTMGKSVIVSNVTPYKEYIEDGENGLFATNWYDEIKYMLNEPEHRKDMADYLSETIKEHFNPIKVAQERGQLYRKIIE